MPTYWELVKPTYIENWPSELYRISIAQIDVPMTLEEANNICEVAWDGPKVKLNLDRLHRELEEALSRMPDGAFVRLGSRSPKDSFVKDSLKVYKASDVLSLFLNSERVFDDLLLAIKQEYIPHVWVRQWVDIPKWAEFRCFMKNRGLVGISQYYYHETYQEIIDDHESIKWTIEQFFRDFRTASHLDSVIFDVYLKKRIAENQTMWEARLLEINPLFELTDPCLFNWHKAQEFNGSIKFNLAKGIHA